MSNVWKMSREELDALYSSDKKLTRAELERMHFDIMYKMWETCFFYQVGTPEGHATEEELIKMIDAHPEVLRVQTTHVNHPMNWDGETIGTYAAKCELLFVTKRALQDTEACKLKNKDKANIYDTIKGSRDFWIRIMEELGHNKLTARLEGYNDATKVVNDFWAIKDEDKHDSETEYKKHRHIIQNEKFIKLHKSKSNKTSTKKANGATTSVIKQKKLIKKINEQVQEAQNLSNVEQLYIDIMDEMFDIYQNGIQDTPEGIARQKAIIQKIDECPSVLNRRQRTCETPHRSNNTTIGIYAAECQLLHITLRALEDEKACAKKNLFGKDIFAKIKENDNFKEQVVNSDEYKDLVSRREETIAERALYDEIVSEMLYIHQNGIHDRPEGVARQKEIVKKIDEHPEILNYQDPEHNSTIGITAARCRLLHVVIRVMSDLNASKLKDKYGADVFTRTKENRDFTEQVVNSKEYKDLVKKLEKKLAKLTKPPIINDKYEDMSKYDSIME